MAANTEVEIQRGGCNIFETLTLSHQVAMATGILRGNASRLYRLARGAPGSGLPHPTPPPPPPRDTPAQAPAPAPHMPKEVTAVRLVMVDTAGLRRCRVVPVDRVWPALGCSRGPSRSCLHRCSVCSVQDASRLARIHDARWFTAIQFSVSVEQLPWRGADYRKHGDARPIRRGH
jgi:hypothetical protein